MSNKPKILVLELDSRDNRFQTGIARYITLLSESMPDNVSVLQIVYLFSPEYTGITIDANDSGVVVRVPVNFPNMTLHDAVINMIGARLVGVRNIIVKCNCLGMESLAYMIKSRFYCKCIGVLHCLPNNALGAGKMFPPNPFFNMDAVISVCDAGRQYLELVHNTRPVSVIYNGIDVPRPPRRSRGTRPFTFVFTNGWAPHKGFPRIIPAIARVAKMRDISVVVVGGGTPDDDTAKQLQGLPIINAGLVPDPSQYYEDADCALFASYSEACSFAGIEAMAYNLPIIFVETAGLNEMFGNAAIRVGENASRALDVDAYADAMLRIIDSHGLRVRLGAMAYGRYLSHYTLKTTVKKTLKLYYDLIGL